MNGKYIVSKIASICKEPKKIFIILVWYNVLNWLPDKLFLKLRYKMAFGQCLNLDNPQTFNEKLQWLKLHDHNPLYITLADKYAVRDYIKEKLGEEYLVPLVAEGAYADARNIDFDKLPNQFVLKCTHDSGSIIICRDKSKFDKESAIKKLNKALKHNYYYIGREWPYKNIKPQIIVEKYMENGNIVPEDYKVYCFNGKPKYIVVFHNRFDVSKEMSETVYDINWNPQKISLDAHFKISDEICPKPECLSEMLETAEKLSIGMAQSRIDFYIIDNSLKFGEVTLYTASGFQPMIPEELDVELGKAIDISGLGGVNQSRYKHNKELTDYKFYSFNGKVKYLYVSTGLENHKTAQISFLEPEWKFAPFERNDYEPYSELPAKPVHYKEMLEIAEYLSKDIPFLRIDLFEVNDRIYFSELTLYPSSGFMPFKPREWDKKIGNELTL